MACAARSPNARRGGPSQSAAQAPRRATPLAKRLAAPTLADPQAHFAFKQAESHEKRVAELSGRIEDHRVEVVELREALADRQLTIIELEQRVAELEAQLDGRAAMFGN